MSQLMGHRVQLGILQTVRRSPEGTYLVIIRTAISSTVQGILQHHHHTVLLAQRPRFDKLEFISIICIEGLQSGFKKELDKDSVNKIMELINKISEGRSNIVTGWIENDEDILKNLL